jgi:hypothetical protein
MWGMTKLHPESFETQCSDRSLADILLRQEPEDEEEDDEEEHSNGEEDDDGDGGYSE